MLVSRAMSRQIKNEDPTLLTLQSTDGWFSSLLATSGESVTPTSAMKIGAVYGCTALISGSMSIMPAHVYQEGKKGGRDRVLHPIDNLLNLRPNEKMTASVLKRVWEIQRLLHGNSYTWIEFAKAGARAGKPVSLIPLPSTTYPHQDDNGSLWYVTYIEKLGYRKFRSDEVLHFKGDMTLDGITGMSVLSAAAESIGTDLAAQKYSGKFYKQGARPSGIVEVPTKLDTPGKNVIRDGFERAVSGMDNAYRVAVLDIGMKYTQLALTQKDSQFVESRNFAKEDIATFFRVPLYKLNAGKQSYNANEQNAIEYVVSTLQPIVTQYEQELTYKLLLDSELGRGQYIRYNMAVELRGDNKSRAEFYEKMIQMAMYTPNDALELEDKPSYEGGDKHFISLNYVPVEYIEEYQRARSGATSPQKGGTE